MIWHPAMFTVYTMPCSHEDMTKKTQKYGWVVEKNSVQRSHKAN